MHRRSSVQFKYEPNLLFQIKGYEKGCYIMKISGFKISQKIKAARPSANFNFALTNWEDKDFYTIGGQNLLNC